MPASLVFGTGPTFRGGLTPRPVSWRATPVEGDRSVAANIAWGTDDINPGGAPTGIVNFNLTGIATQEFSQIAALYVDNLTSGADVDFVFQDTQFRLTVPAGSQGLYPVISTTRTFVALSPDALPGDQTFMQILNSLPPPVAIEKSVFMSSANITARNVIVPSVTQLVAAGIDGTMTALQISISAAHGGAAGGTVDIIVRDGTAKILGAVSVGFLDGTTFIPSQLLLDIDDVNVRFKNGATLNVTIAGTAPAAGNIDVSFFYRTP